MPTVPTSTLEQTLARVQDLRITADTLTVQLTDAREVSVPLAWYPRLLNAEPKERRTWRLIARGERIHWPDLDEDISVQNILLGQPSGESQESFKKWLSKRKPKGRLV